MSVSRLYRVFLLCTGAAAVAGCRETGPTPPVVTPVAGLRYINAVGDTGAMDFRVVDIVGDAPASFAAAFRGGGNPSGFVTNLPPPYQAVQAGSRRIRVFMSSSDPAIASIVMLDTTFNFAENTNYTFILYGYARTGQTPRAAALITTDDAQAPPTGQITIRTVHAALQATAPTGVGNVDLFVALQGTVPLGGAPTSANQGHLGVSGYTPMASGLLRVAATAPGTTTPILFQVFAPAGVAATSTDPAIGGTNVAGTALTAVILPPSVVGSRAPFSFTGIQAISPLTSSGTTATGVTLAPHNLTSGSSVIINGADTAVYNGTFTVTVVDPTTFTYTIRRATTGSPATGYPFWLAASQGASFNGLPISRLTATGTTATLVTLASHGLATNDIVTISGANEPEYNGSFAVTRTDATTVTYTTNGTPAASPVTGAPVWRRGADDFTRPNIMFLIDRRP